MLYARTFYAYDSCRTTYYEKLHVQAGVEVKADITPVRASSDFDVVKLRRRSLCLVVTMGT